MIISSLGAQMEPPFWSMTNKLFQMRCYQNISNMETSHHLSDKYLKKLIKLNMYNFHKNKNNSKQL